MQGDLDERLHVLVFAQLDLLQRLGDRRGLAEHAEISPCLRNVPLVEAEPAGGTRRLADAILERRVARRR